MPKNNFLKRKKDILNKQDKSLKGCYDKKIISLCKKINKLDNYYTTSSCSGRVVIMVDKEKKQSGVFLFVSHDLITFKELKGVLNKIASLCSDIDKKFVNDKTSFKQGLIVNRSIKIPRRGQTFKFKQEPCILHVACKDLQSALNLLRKAQLAGFKRAGIIAIKNRFMCELLSTEKLEFPIIDKGKLLVNYNFLKVIVKKSNENLKKTWQKIERLEKSL